jgi:hypothetical protein
VFGKWLAHAAFAGRIDRVVFAIYDPKGGRTLAAFQERFKAAK